MIEPARNAVARSTVAPALIHTSVVPLEDQDHFCGWRLVHRWILAAGLLGVVPPDPDNYDQLAIASRQLVDDVITDSVDEWVSNNIHHEDWFPAMRHGADAFRCFLF